MKQIVRIYYKSDWSIAIKLPNGYDNENFIIRLFTTDSYNYFEAKYIDGVYTHCTVDTEENTAIIYVDDHKLNAGCLHVMQAYDYDNNHFADGVETLATIEDSNIYLVKNNPNSTSAMFIGSALPDLTGVSDYVTKSDLAAASYATTSYVAEYVAQHAPTPDLSSYVTKTELNNAGYITQETLIEASYVTQDALSSMGYITTIPEEYVTQNALNTALNGYVTNDALSQASYVTEQALSQASYVTNDSLSQASYATKTYVADYVAQHAPTPDLSAYVTKTELDNAGYITSIPSEYVTESELSAMGYITSIPEEYITESELSAMGYITSIPSEYITESELNAMGYITSIPSEYITESELASMSYATQTYVADYVAQHAPTPDLSAYVTKTELDAAGYISSIPTEYVTDSELSAMGYITSIPSEYITESELSQAGYATKTYVADYVATYGGNVDLSAYVTKTELDNAGYITSIPSEYITESELSQAGYATKTYVADYVAQYAPTPDLSAYVTKTELDNAGYITSIPSEYITESDLSSMGYITSIPSEYITENELAAMGYITSIPVEYITDSELSAMGYITSIPSEYVTESELAQAGYATKAYVADYVATYGGNVDLSAYVTKTELDNAGYITSIPSEYVTDSELSAMGYITSIPVEYITENELAAMSYATQTYVADYVATYGGNVDLSAYVTKTELDAAAYCQTYECTQAEYDALVSGGLTYANTLYIITDAVVADLAYYATQTYVVDYVSQHGSNASVYSVTYAEYQDLINAGTYDPTTLYLITDGTPIDMSGYVTQASLSANAYLTYANFIYDSTTNTLTISI